VQEEPVIKENATQRSSITFAALLSILLAGSVLLNVLLARKVSSLRQQQASVEASDRLQVGASVPPLTGYSVDGKPMSVSFGDPRIPTVLYVFSPRCGWCAKNIDNFHSLIAQAGARYQIVGLATNRQDLEAYLLKEHLTLPVLAGVDSTLVTAYHLGATLTTIVISPDGKVLRVWTGAYRENTRHQIESFLGVHLHPCCDEGSSEPKTDS